jgi:hypothetical protein
MSHLVTAAGASGSPGRQAVEPGWGGSAPPPCRGLWPAAGAPRVPDAGDASR